MLRKNHAKVLSLLLQHGLLIPMLLSRVSTPSCDPQAMHFRFRVGKTHLIDQLYVYYNKPAETEFMKEGEGSTVAY